MSDTEKITGEVVHIIYENQDNGYTVMEVENDDDSFITVGYFYNVSEGETVCLTGHWITHDKYGEQFKTEVYERIPPVTRAAMVKYLGSGMIKGIGTTTAKKLVEKFGEDTLEIIEKEPERLASIRGISPEKAMKIHESYMTKTGSSSLVMFLQDCGISVSTAAKVYKKFGTSAMEILRQNPYILCEEIDGIGFKIADELAKKLDIHPESMNRVKAGCVYLIKYNTQFGHTYLPRAALEKLARSMLNVNCELISDALNSLVRDGIFVSENSEGSENIYYYTHYRCEQYTANKLCEIAKYKYDYSRDDVLKQLNIIEKKHGITFAQMQREAVVCAMQSSVLVITGGPGTGKTTIINAIIDIMRSNGLTVSLTAPTGRAAKRMTQVCSLEAKTIHRLLEAGYYGNSDEMEFMVNENDPIDADVVIADEMSMVDIVLINNFLKAVKPGTRLIFVGDVNQLPSVGPGNVLRDIIESDVVPVIRLTEIFRQARESLIVTNAHRINDGEYPILDSKDGDFFFADIPNPAAGAQYIASLCSKRLPDKYGVNPFDIQVLSPAKKGISGVHNLNELLRDVLNPPDKKKKEHSFGQKMFREGDKVMQIRNNYDIQWTNVTDSQKGSGVFNGDVGVISSIRSEFKTITVMFDDKKVVYNFSDVPEELEAAYCITIHKSQGSEFPIVIIPMYEAPPMLINRNLLYTGVTRARKTAILVGKKSVVRAMVDNNREDKRYSGLKERLARCNERKFF